MRAAAREAATAGLSEHLIATLAGVSQPTAHAWLDDRRIAIMPAASLAADAWSLRTVAAATLGLVARFEGRHLPEAAPTSHHCRPVDAARRAREALEEAAAALAQLGAALDYEAADRGGGDGGGGARMLAVPAPGLGDHPFPSPGASPGVPPCMVPTIVMRSSCVTAGPGIHPWAPQASGHPGSSSPGRCCGQAAPEPGGVSWRQGEATL